MFFPPKLKTILAALLAVTICATATDLMAQQSAEFEKRAAAMRRARARAMSAQTETEQVISSDLGQYNSGSEMTLPPEPARRVARTAQTAQTAQTARSPRLNGPHTRTATVRNARTGARRRVAAALQPQGSGSRNFGINQAPIIQEGPIIEGGAPIYDGSVIEGDVINSYPDGSYPNQLGSSYDQGYIVDEGHYGGEVLSSSCNSCGVAGDYFEAGACESCCGRGGCPTGGSCWIGDVGAALGGLLRNGEYFAGAVAFQSPLFTQPGQDVPVDPNLLSSDSSFGFYGGFNTGVPLCRLSCGYLSGQFGIRSVTSNFNGNEFTAEDRRQIFVTAGLYRRVDYGLQFGVVADVLHEEWFTETDLVQIRSDIGWVYPSGHTLGFRYTSGVQDDNTSGVFNGQEFTDFFTTVDDSYRVYYRHVARWGGWGEAFLGRAESDQTVFGLDVDLPVTDRVAFQSGFTASLDDDVVPDNSNFQGGNINEGWNVYVGITIRPRGRAWYKSYDHPLFAVADNGSMIVRRQSPELDE